MSAARQARHRHRSCLPLPATPASPWPPPPQRPPLWLAWVAAKPPSLGSSTVLRLRRMARPTVRTCRWAASQPPRTTLQVHGAEEEAKRPFKEGQWVAAALGLQRAVVVAVATAAGQAEARRATKHLAAHLEVPQPRCRRAPSPRASSPSPCTTSRTRTLTRRSGAAVLVADSLALVAITRCYSKSRCEGRWTSSGTALATVHCPPQRVQGPCANGSP